MQKTMLLSTTTTTTWFLLILITFKTTHWTFLLMLDIPYLNFFLAHSIVSLDFKINGKWEKKVEKCGNYKWPKILKRFNLDFKKYILKIIDEKYQSSKSAMKNQIFWRKIKTPWILKRNICLPKNTYESFCHILSFLISHFLVNKKNLPNKYLLKQKKLLCLKHHHNF